MGCHMTHDYWYDASQFIYTFTLLIPYAINRFQEPIWRARVNFDPSMYK